MVNDLRQGEIWWAEAEDKRRPVLIVSRSEAAAVLNRLVVAPVTRTVRGIPTEIAVGPEDGMPELSAASFDNLQPIERGFLTERAAVLAAWRRPEICRALQALADC